MPEPLDTTHDAEAMLRKHAAMYDWSKKEQVVTNDFILTIREGVQADLDARAPTNGDDHGR